jgi:hypothetical protein
MTDLTAGDIRDIDGGTLSVFIDSIRGDVVSFTVVDGPNRMIGKGFKSSIDDLCDRLSDGD